MSLLKTLNSCLLPQEQNLIQVLRGPKFLQRLTALMLLSLSELEDAQRLSLVNAASKSKAALDTRATDKHLFTAVPY